MRCRVAVLALCLALGARSETTVRAKALPTPTSTPAAKASSPVTGAKSRSARIRAKGLDPADPNLKVRLEALAAEDSRVKRSLDGLKEVSISTAAHSPSPLLSALGGATPPRVSARVHKGRPPSIKHLWWDSITSQLTEGRGYTITGDIDPATRTFRVRLDFGPCGTFTADADLFDVTSLKDVPAVASLFAKNPEVYGAPGVSYFPHRLPALQQGELRVVTDGASSNAIPVKTDDSFRATQAVRVTIVAGVPHFSGNGGVGLTPANMQMLSGPRISTTPEGKGGTGGAGIDQLGIGVSLPNGYTASARIVRVHSYMDTPSHPAVADGYRSASIQEQPKAGQLLTKVAWSYVAGESIEYELEWTLTGRPFTRPLSTMPKPACGE